MRKVGTGKLTKDEVVRPEEVPKAPDRTLSMVPGSRSTRMARAHICVLRGEGWVTWITGLRTLSASCSHLKA